MAAEIYDRANRLCDLNQSNPATWEVSVSFPFYFKQLTRMKPVLEDNGFLDIWHGSAYYEIRQIPKVYSLWAQLLRYSVLLYSECYLTLILFNRHHDLTLGMDRVSLKVALSPPPPSPSPLYSNMILNLYHNKPPAYVDVEGELSLPKKFIDRVEALEGGKNRVWFKQPDFRIHNDMNMWDLKECKYQGGIALQDCPKGAGGFRCIPVCTTPSHKQHTYSQPTTPRAIINLTSLDGTEKDMNMANSIVQVLNRLPKAPSSGF